MAWIKDQELLQQFKQAYRGNEISECIQLLDEFQADEVEYFSDILAERIVSENRTDPTQLYDLCRKCEPHVSKPFAKSLLSSYFLLGRDMISRKIARPFAEVREAVYDVVIPISRDFLNRDITFLTSFGGLLKFYMEKGIFDDEGVAKYRKMREDPKIREVEQYLKAAYEPLDGFGEFLERDIKSRELKKVLES